MSHTDKDTDKGRHLTELRRRARRPDPTRRARQNDKFRAIRQSQEG